MVPFPTVNQTQKAGFRGRLILSIVQLVIAVCFCLIFYIFYTSFRGEFLIVVKGMWILPLFLALLVGGAVHSTVVAIVSLKRGRELATIADRIGSRIAGNGWYWAWALWNILVAVPIAWVGKTLIMGALGSVPNGLIVALSLPFFGAVGLLVASGVQFLVRQLRGYKEARLMTGTVEMGLAFFVAFGLFAFVAVTWRPQWAEGVVHTELFTPGDEPGRGYRIPAMVVLPGDVVLAFAESRIDAMSDLLDIHIVMRRSLDGGETWGPIQVVVDEGSHTVHSPTPLYDAETATVWLPFCIDYATLYIVNSADMGQTWSAPRNLSEEMGLGDDIWCHAGPGNGIQMSNGRLVIPVALNDATVVYSDDHGRTWLRGGVIAPREEPQVFERADGALCANMRSERGSYRVVSCSHDGGETWEPWRYNTDLPDAGTQGSIMRFTTEISGSRNLVLFSNPGVPYRGSLTIRLSYDGGETWPVSRLVYEGAAGYSQLAVLSDGTILVLFEAGRYDLRESLTLARVDLGWLTQGQAP